MSAQSRVSSLFPSILLPKLAHAHGRKWARLVERVANLPETHPEYLAYTLMIRRLAHLTASNQTCICVEPGCIRCAVNILERYDGSERDLIEEYRHTLEEIKSYLAGVEDISLVA